MYTTVSCDWPHILLLCLVRFARANLGLVHSWSIKNLEWEAEVRISITIEFHHKYLPMNGYPPLELFCSCLCLNHTSDVWPVTIHVSYVMLLFTAQEPFMPWYPFNCYHIETWKLAEGSVAFPYYGSYELIDECSESCPTVESMVDCPLEVMQYHGIPIQGWLWLPLC